MEIYSKFYYNNINNRFLGTNNIYTYLIFMGLTLLSFKYFVRCKPKLYDLMILVLMMLIKVIIEVCFYLPLQAFFDIYKIAILHSIIKVILVFIFRNYLNLIYDKLKIYWDNNNFYIRYLFSVLMFVYCIISGIFIIMYYLGK